MQYNNRIINTICKSTLYKNKNHLYHLNNKYYSYKFTPNHQWIKILNNNDNSSGTGRSSNRGTSSNYSNTQNEARCLLGITNYANIAIDKVTDIKLPNANDSIKRDQPIISIKTMEGDLDFRSPISGKVIKVNENLKNDPSQINKPLSTKQSWVVELLINSQNKNIIKNQLMDQLEYAHYCNDVDFKQF